MKKWNFPSNEGGQVKGVADAGIENFNGTELASLAREICQNSLDASIDEDMPVIVEFERYLIDSIDVPGIDEYRRILSDCKTFWDGSNSEKAKNYLAKALKAANKEKTAVLRISDYNTTGLSDPYETDSDNAFSFDGWNALVKIDGGASKGDDKAGAFGIGKSAPFCNSDYRLVFYRTLNQQGERAAQGISRLMSLNKNTSGVGYYGNPVGNAPVESIIELDELNKRHDIGTDVFVYGFNGSTYENEWENQIVCAILDSFLMAIYRGNLIVRVQGRQIDKKNIGDYIERYYKTNQRELKGTYGNYLALQDTDESGIYKNDFHGMGTLVLRIYVSDNEKLDRKVLVVRKAGMKLFRLGNLSKLASFSGILELHGKELNKYFREMETVAHDNWEPGRHSNKKEAKQYYEEIKEWIRKIIAENVEKVSTEEMNVEGLSGILQEEQDSLGANNEDKIDNLDDYLGNIEVSPRTYSKQSKGLFYGKGNEGSGKKEKEKGTLGSEGESGIRVLKGTRKRKKIEKHKGLVNQDGDDIVLTNKSNGEKNCPLKSVRVIKAEKGKYKVGFVVPKNVLSGRVEIVSVGENGKTSLINIKSANCIVGCNSVSVKKGSVEFSNMPADSKVQIEIEPVDARDYAMEVNVYEYN